jgi:hypothetical protein
MKALKATAIILCEGKKDDVASNPDDANAFKGTGYLKTAKGTTIVVTLTISGHDAAQARITLN